VRLLLLAAAVVVVLGYFWLLGLLVCSDRDRTPITWLQVGITTVLCAAAAAGLVTCLIW
jgi:hypothetical protein